MNSPVVRLYDTPITELPDDLYIPPEAFAVYLAQFEGPLDFLLYLVKKNNVDLSQIAILPIAEQYLRYIGRLEGIYFELAGDYLLMASTLIAIKSALLLPTPSLPQDETNPTKALLERLADYAQIKSVSEKLDRLARLERDVFLAYASLPKKPPPIFAADKLKSAFIALSTTTTAPKNHAIKADNIPLATRIVAISEQLKKVKQASFLALLDKDQGKLGVVVSFIAVLELIKRRCIRAENSKDDTLTLIWQGD